MDLKTAGKPQRMQRKTVRSRRLDIHPSLFTIHFLLLFFLFTGLAFTLKAGAENVQDAVEGQPAQSHPADQGSETGAEGIKAATDIVAARVNGAEITMQQVMTMMNRMIAKRGHADTAHDDLGEIRKAALNRLILQELALQQAKGLGIKAEQNKIDDAISALKEIGRAHV